MIDYLIRRLLLGVLTLALISFIVYGLIRMMPGTAVTALQTEDVSKKINAADLESMRASYGLDKKWYVAYFLWLGKVLLHGDLGRSFEHKEDVGRLIWQRIGPTLLLSATSLVLTYLLAVPLGLYATARGGRIDERVLSTVQYMLYSFPVFVAAVMLQLFFAVRLKGSGFELPLFGMVGDDYERLSPGGKALDLFRHIILPVTAETYGLLAYYSRFVQSNLQEVIRQDYIRTARAKGVSAFRTLTVHAFRNTLIPMVTMLGLTLPGLLSGAIIIEQIFTWPGMGRLFFGAIAYRDYPVVMGLTLMFSVLTLVGQLFADLMYAVVDPRVALK